MRAAGKPNEIDCPPIIKYGCKKKRTSLTRKDVRFGRGRRIRTLGTRFWRPLLYQLSYSPVLCVPFWLSPSDDVPFATLLE